MRQTLIIAFMGLFAFGCNDKSTTTEVKTTEEKPATTTVEKLDYAYTLEKPYNDWQPGDQMHAVNVLKSLKAYENGDIGNCITAFGDSIELRFDGYHEKMSNDSLRKMFTKSRGELSGLKIIMGDWESVISKDKKLEYVTIWYKEIQTDKKGKTDSLSIVDDLKIEKGKIVELDQKIQHFPAVKKT